MNIPVAVGVRYIASHAVLRLLQDGHHGVVLDNLFNCSAGRERQNGWRQGAWAWSLDACRGSAEVWGQSCGGRSVGARRWQSN